MNDREPVGFLPCKQCLSLKKVFQGQGKRARYLYTRCDCGLDQRTGAAIQSAWSKHTTEPEALEALEALKQPEKTEEPEKPKRSKAPLVIMGALAVFGLFKLKG